MTRLAAGAFKARAMPSLRYTPITCACCLTFLSVSALLNALEFIESTSKVGHLARGLNIFEPITTIIAKFVPAVDNVFIIVNHSQYAGRSLFFRDVVGLNWVLLLVFSVPCIIALSVEMSRNREALYVPARYETELMKWPPLVANYAFLLTMLWSFYSGFAFTEETPELYTDNAHLLMITFYFTGFGFLILNAAAACIRALLKRSGAEHNGRSAI